MVYIVPRYIIHLNAVISLFKIFKLNNNIRQQFINGSYFMIFYNLFDTIPLECSSEDLLNLIAEEFGASGF